MGTRSLTHIIDNDFDQAERILTIYRQFDGYPEGHGKELAEFINSKTFVNGIGGDSNVFNGAGCFAAQLVAHLKDGPGSVYIARPGASDMGEEFIYWVTISGTQIDFKVTYDNGDVIFRGTSNTFLLYLMENA